MFRATIHKLIPLVILFILFRLTISACSCMDSPTTEQAYKRSDLVIQGRIVGIDTINSSNSLLYDKKGIKIGRYRYTPHIENFLRVKMIIEKSFKLIADLPDTIYVLTKLESDACGYPFPPFVGEGVLPDSYYRFIVYGNKWIEKKIIRTKKGNRYVGQIKESQSSETFFTNTCSRTQHLNEKELKNLSVLKT